MKPHSKVTKPYPRYLQDLVDETQRASGGSLQNSVSGGGASDNTLRGLEAAIAEISDEILNISHAIFDHPETSFEEVFAANAVKQLVESHGIPVDVGTFGLPTSFIATIGSGEPVVAILAEYDALPGIGHGCGHNVICASAVGAFLGLAAVASKISGQVRLVGTPAEEGGSGKELIARAGGFKDVDAALMIHPGNSDIGPWPGLGMRTVDVIFTGLAAHAAAAPYMGRNALDAVVAAYTGISQLRQHMLPSDRIHGVITDGGSQANVVPSRTGATFYVRSERESTMSELCARVEQVFQAAALMTATEVEILWDPSPEELPVRTNHVMLNRFTEHMTRRGRRMEMSSMPELSFNGSTDFGNVSALVPGIHPTLAIAPVGVPAHSEQFASYARSAEGDRACLDGAFALAATTADLLVDNSVLAAALGEFGSRTRRSAGEL